MLLNIYEDQITFVYENFLNSAIVKEPFAFRRTPEDSKLNGFVCLHTFSRVLKKFQTDPCF